MKLSVPWLQKSGFQGHPRSSNTESGAFGVKIQRFSNLGKLYIKMKLLMPWLQKSGFRGHPRSSDPKLGGIWDHLGPKEKNFKPRQIIYQNEALGALITKTWFPRSPEVLRPQIWGYFVRKGDWSTNLFERSEMLRRRDRSTNYLEQSERLRRGTCPLIASSEARG